MDLFSSDICMSQHKEQKGKGIQFRPCWVLISLNETKSSFLLVLPLLLEIKMFGAKKVSTNNGTSD